MRTLVCVLICVLSLTRLAFGGPLNKEFQAYQASLKKQDPKGALAHSKRLMELSAKRSDRTRALILFNHAELLLRLGKPKPSIPLFEASAKLLETNKNDEYLNRALVLRMLLSASLATDDRSKAVHTLHEIDKELKPLAPTALKDIAVVKNMLATFALEISKPKRAMAYAVQLRGLMRKYGKISPMEEAKLNLIEGILKIEKSEFKNAAAKMEAAYEAILPKDRQTVLAKRALFYAAYAYRELKNPKASEKIKAIQEGCDICAELDDPPKIIHFERPIYPSEMIVRRSNGLVLLRYDVDKEGRPKNVEAIEEIPQMSYFAAQSVKALRKFRFVPATKDGVAVEVPNRYFFFHFAMRPN